MQREGELVAVVLREGGNLERLWLGGTHFPDALCCVQSLGRAQEETRSLLPASAALSSQPLLENPQSQQV